MNIVRLVLDRWKIALFVRMGFIFMRILVWKFVLIMFLLLLEAFASPVNQAAQPAIQPHQTAPHVIPPQVSTTQPACPSVQKATSLTTPSVPSTTAWQAATTSK